MDLSIIIVSWNVKNALRANLKRLFALNGDVEFEVIVVDNASEDGTARMVRQEFGEVKLVQNDWNAGFGHACNQGIGIATGRNFVMLNPDMLVGNGVFERVCGVLEGDVGVGLVGVRLVDGGGRVNRSVRLTPSVFDQLAITFKLSRIFGEVGVVERYLCKGFDYRRSQDVEQIRGSFFAFRRDLMDVVGLFDERFFLWFEEVDYCNRVREAGFVIRYLADVECVDLIGQSFGQVKLWKKQGLFFKSMAQYFWKWGNKAMAVLIYLLRPGFMLGGSLKDLKDRVL